MKRILFIFLVLTTLVLGLTGCASDIETFEKYVREGNYAEAIPLYQEKLMDSLQDNQACRELVETYLTESLDSYRQGELPQDEFDTIMHTMEQLEDHLYLVDNLENIHSEYQDVKESKAEYRRAESLQNDGQLEAAMEAYSAVLPEDTENFSNARENLEALLKQINEDACNAVIQAYESKDYPAVFLAYREAEQNRYVTLTAELTEIYEASALEYLRAAAEQAEQAFGGEEKDYQAAMEVLLNARAAVSEETELLAELEALSESYKAYIPVNLSELKPVQQMYYVKVGTYDSDVYNDINSNSHEKNSVISPTGTYAYDGRAKSDDEAYVTYNLNFNYSTFSGTIYRPYVFLSYTGEVNPGGCAVRIYGDDVLLYEFSDPGDTWDVIPVEVDVSGVRNLKIVIRGCWNSSTALLAPPDWQPAICLADGVLQK